MENRTLFFRMELKEFKAADDLLSRALKRLEDEAAIQREQVEQKVRNTMEELKTADDIHCKELARFKNEAATQRGQVNQTVRSAEKRAMSCMNEVNDLCTIYIEPENML